MNISSKSLPFFAAVEEALRAALALPQTDASAAPLLASARHLVLAGGKRARPWLVHTFGEIVGAPTTSLTDLAVAAELIHAASLLHDDVIDEGQERRGRPTANVLWGNLTAVLSGDLLLTLALQRLRPYPAGISHGAVDTVATMTRASLVEAAARGHLDMSPEGWRAMAAGKTAELFAWCGSAAALLVDDELAAARFQGCARHLGVAFQLANDLDDLYGRTPGKDALADIHNQNPSYPVLVAVAASGAARRVIEGAWAKPVLDGPTVRAVLDAVAGAGADRATLGAIEEEIDRATEALGPLGAHPSAAPIVHWAQQLGRRARPEAGGDGPWPAPQA